MNWIFSLIILLTGHFLIGFCFVSFIKPAATQHFLRQFASSAKAHYIEQLIRIVIGISLILNASQMQLMHFHLVLGWLIVITSLGLLGIPWRWHKRFADKVIRLLPLYAIGCLTLGSILIYGVLG